MSTKKIIAITAPNTSAYLRLCEKQDGSVIVWGYAVQSDTLVRIDGSHKHQRKCKNYPADIDAAVRYVASKIEKEQHNKKCVSNTHAHKTGIYTAAYNAIENPMQLCQPTWAESTCQGTLSYFSRQVLPRLDAMGDDPPTADLQAMFDELVTKAMLNGRSNRNREQAAKNVSAYLFRCDSCYRKLRMLALYLPPIDLSPAIPHMIVVSPEQAKWLPEDIRKELTRRVSTEAPDSGAITGIALIYWVGLRTAEGAAVKCKDIILRDDHVVIPILTQIQRHHETALKTDNAYRIVVGPKILRDILKQRFEVMRKNGYTEDDYICADTPGAVPRPGKISDLGRKLLQEVGYSREAFDAASELQFREPDLGDNGLPTVDVTAYVFRRDWCTRACNICGMNSEDVDYLMGHAREDRKQIKDYTSPDIQAALAKQLERYIYDPAHSCDPSAVPMNVSAPIDEVEISDRRLFTLVNSGDAPIRVCVEAHSREPADPIVITAPTRAGIRLKRGHKDTPDDRAKRKIIT